ncbi:MAG: tRNA dihydrouridine synthase DusB [Agarilytica sp.]
MFTIGPYAIHSQALLAPMAGVTDLPFRKICQELGAGLTTSEMVTSNTDLWNSAKSQFRLVHDKRSKIPNSIQIAGSDPELMADAAQHAVSMGAQIIDINMGCPAKKVCKKLAGSALLKDEKLVGRILSSVVSRVDVPVTLKTRTGWDTDHKNGVDIAKLAENEGIQALAVHGRTRACKFQGNAEYDTIAEIASRLSIPVIANGDIDSPEKAKSVLNYTGAQAVMIGRAAFGNPWIFAQITKFLNEEQPYSLPTGKTITQVMDAHFKDLYQHYGDPKGIRIARKHFAWYCQQHGGDSITDIQTFYQLETIQSQLEAVNSLFKRPYLNEDKVA